LASDLAAIGLPEQPGLPWSYAVTHPAAGPDRLPPLPREALNAEQQQALDALLQGPRGVLQGPFIPMLRSAGFMNRAQKVGEYIRYESPLAADLRELAILVTARHWNQAIEWTIHAPIALKDGVSRDALVALAEDRVPDLQGAQAIVYRYCSELHRTQGVSDALYAEALEALGETVLIDLTGLCGYYALLAMIMNVARTPLPEGAQPFAIPSAA
jgi:4-carboxymuconolactone decarboxylase